MTRIITDNGAPGVLTIDLGALASNYRLFKSMTAADVACVIKANGYGLGMEQVFETLYAEGCRKFYVVCPDEALSLRAFSKSKDITIAVLNGLFAGAENAYIAHDLVPVLCSLEDITRWQSFAKKAEKPLPAIVHFDTGMNRLGLPKEETITFLANRAFYLDGLDLQIVMSHFIASEEDNNPLNDLQYQKFKKIAAHFPDVKKSLCNSGGLFRSKDYHFDEVRPGIALYGGNPGPYAVNPVKAVASLKARVARTLHVKKGQTVGYNATYTFPEDTEIAAVCLGYADGFPWSAQHKAILYWNGRPCPVRGKVSMDTTMVEIAQIQGQKPKPGDMMEVIGPHQSVGTLAGIVGTIDYEILTNLGPRFYRVYKS